MNNFYIICISLFIIYYIAFVIRKWRFLKFAYGKNGFFAPILPVFGHTYILLFLKKKFCIVTAIDLVKKLFGLPYNLWLGEEFYYVTDDPQDIRTILSHPKCLNKAAKYDFVRSYFGESLFVTTDTYWKPRRANLRAHFKPSVLKTQFLVIYNESLNIIDQLKTLPPDENLFHFFNKYASKIFFLTSADLKEENCYSEVDAIGKKIYSLQEQLASSVLNPIKTTNMWTTFSGEGKSGHKMIEEARNVIAKIVNARRNELNKSKEECFDDHDLTPMLDSLLNSDIYKTEKELVDEYLIIYFAGSDTSGHTLAFCFTFLGMYPEIQDKVYNEVMSVSDYNEFSYDQLAHLKYLEAFILESLRFCPTGPILGRKATDDIQLKDKILPKGSNIGLCLFHAHRNEKYWKNPLEFDPTRFFSENSVVVQPNTFFAFSAGPRDCLGKVQGMIILKTTIANVIKHFRITSGYKTIDEFKFTSLISLRTIHNLDCKFIPRETILT